MDGRVIAIEALVEDQVLVDKYAFRLPMPKGARDGLDILGWGDAEVEGNHPVRGLTFQAHAPGLGREKKDGRVA